MGSLGRPRSTVTSTTSHIQLEEQDESDNSHVFWKLLCQTWLGPTKGNRVVNVSTFPHVLCGSQSIAQGSIIWGIALGRGLPEMISLSWQWANRAWNPVTRHLFNLLKRKGQVTLVQTLERPVCPLAMSSIVKSLARRQLRMVPLSHHITCPLQVSLSSHTGSPINHTTNRDFPRRWQRQQRSGEVLRSHMSDTPRSIKTLHHVCVCVCVCVCMYVCVQVNCFYVVSINWMTD
jgi:hypothetical protein